MFSSAIHDRSESRPARLPNGRPACIGPGRRGHELHELRTVSQPIDAPELPGARPPVHVTRTCPPKVRAYRRCDQVALCFESASKHVVISGALVRDLRCAPSLETCSILAIRAATCVSPGPTTHLSRAGSFQSHRERRLRKSRKSPTWRRGRRARRVVLKPKKVASQRHYAPCCVRKSEVCTTPCSNAPHAPGSVLLVAPRSCSIDIARRDAAARHR